jgi:hypothetical protein
MTRRSGTTAGELVAQAQRDLVETAEAIRCHRFLERLRSRETFVSSRPARCSVAQSRFWARVGEGMDQLGVDPVFAGMLRWRTAVGQAGPRHALGRCPTVAPVRAPVL